MFDFSLVELAVVVVVALLLLKPEDVPAAARKLGAGLRKLRQFKIELEESFSTDLPKTGRIKDLNGTWQKTYPTDRPIREAASDKAATNSPISEHTPDGERPRIPSGERAIPASRAELEEDE